jgi:hypothetical protein
MARRAAAIGLVTPVTSAPARAEGDKATAEALVDQGKAC